MTYDDYMGRRLALKFPQFSQTRLFIVNTKQKIRLFAQQCGMPVPRLYWAGYDIPWELLPDPVVIKPDWGSFAKGVYAVHNGVNVITGQPFDRTQVVTRNAHGHVSIAEEFVLKPDGAIDLPWDHKTYGFGDDVPAIQVVDRVKKKIAWFDADWNVREPVHTSSDDWAVEPDYFTRPASLQQIVEGTRVMSKRFGTFLRCDFYDTVGGAVLGEVATYPVMGKNTRPDPNVELGRLWEKNFGMAL